MYDDDDDSQFGANNPIPLNPDFYFDTSSVASLGPSASDDAASQFEDTIPALSYLYPAPSSVDSPASPTSDGDDSQRTHLSPLSESSNISSSTSHLPAPEAPDVIPLPRRARAHPHQLNTEWRNFFRDSLLAHDPAAPRARRDGGNPSETLPPPLRTAPNEPSGDNFATKPRDSFLLWSVNANGISSQNDFAALRSLCVSLRSCSADAVALQEPNIDFMQADVRQKYNEIFKEHFGQARILTATSCIEAPKLWKPGGVVLVVLGSWAQHITKVSCDDLGRWVSATMTGSDGDSVTIYSFYNVVDVKLQHAGPSTVFAQQYRLLKFAGVTYPNPRQQCVDDLQREVAKSVANKEAIVIIGDFNEALGRDTGLMASVCSTNGHFDVHALFHGEQADIPTYARGSKRLDYCVASRHLEDFVASCGYNLFNELIHSDHRAQLVDFKLKSFFGHGTPTLARPDLRSITSSSTAVTKFVRKMHAHLTEQSAFHKYQEFQLDAEVLDEPWKMANNLDALIGQAFKTAEKTCAKHMRETPKTPWSSKLHHASLKVRYWATVLTERNTKVPQTTVLHNLAAEIWKLDPPATPRITKTLKNIGTAAKRALRRIQKNAVAEREAFLQEFKARLAQRMSSKDADVASAIKTIDRQLTSGRRFRRIARALKPATSAPLTKVEIASTTAYLHPVTGNTVEFKQVKVIDARQAL
jgi:exonuclease III